MANYKIYIPGDRHWREADAPGIEEACAIWGVRSSDVWGHERIGGKWKLVCKPSAEPERSVYLGGD